LIPVARLQTVGIRELKNRLSEYLREVRLGTTVLVTDRGVVVAEIREPETRHGRTAESGLMASWVEQGRVRAPVSAKKPVGPTSVRLPEGVARSLLDQERGT
jgi:antitoxin (DNA-binding transcriptional repressor) of toxin-antitoxin stability system